MRINRSGFTIVELLIVIVVIGILASITIVAYSGVQKRARISVAQSELNNLGQAAEIYNIENAAYPDGLEWSEVFKVANMYDNTRDGGVKTFMICRDATNFAIIASTPVHDPTDGGMNYYYSSVTQGIESFAWDTSTPGTFTLDKGCAQTNLSTITRKNWAHSI